MIKILVITICLGISETRCYVFDDYIVRENIFFNEDIKNTIGIQYMMLSLDSLLLYEVPKELNQRKVSAYHPTGGSWRFEGHEVTKIETEKTKLDKYKCLKVTESNLTQTPLGPSDSKTIKYFANLKKLLGRYPSEVYYFLGFNDLTYDPYKCLIRSDLVYSDSMLFTILEVEIGYEMSDRRLIEKILALPQVDEK